MIPAVYFKTADGTEIGPNALTGIRQFSLSEMISPTTELYEKGFWGGKGKSYTAEQYLRKFGPEHDSQIRMTVALVIGMGLLLSVFVFFPKLLDTASSESNPSVEYHQKIAQLQSEYEKLQVEGKDLQRRIDIAKRTNSSSEIYSLTLLINAYTERATKLLEEKRKLEAGGR